MKEPIIKGEFLLQKSPGKGGWTYASIPGKIKGKSNAFGWVKVKGSIDGFPIQQYNIMPLNNGHMFLPVKAAIRKIIGKWPGDYVKVVLYLDEDPIQIPEDIMECFRQEPASLLLTFQSFTEGQQKAYLDWIYAAKKEDTQADRIALMMHKLSKNLTLHQQEKNE
ncbi:YdeI/OmpD-associated family protein [Flagellimonas algicola]|nr:YdeI/OmpD-associated family protein [Allomuricauda algicola]